MAGVIESERAANRKTGSTGKPGAAASLEAVAPTSVPATATPRPHPVPTSAPSAPVPAAPTAYTPEVIQTAQSAVPPAQQQLPAPAAIPQTVCPSGVVESGMTDVTVVNERYTTVANISTEADVLGHGLIRNRTTAPVYIFDSAPSVKGLDVSGRLTFYLTGEFDWTPPVGQPRPPQITLQPGQDLTYTVRNNEVLTKTLRETAAWYVNPKDSVDYYSDFRTYADCPPLTVVALPGGTSIMNTYVPWGQ